MAGWRLEAGPSTSAPRVQLTTARGRKFSFRLNEPSTVEFTVDGRSPEALDLVELGTDVHASRDGDGVLLTARLGSTQDTLDDAKHEVQCSGADVRALLARRLTTTARTYAGTDVGVFVADMLTDAQTAPAGSPAGAGLGITVPTFPATGVTLNRTSKAYAPILTELTEAQATGVDDGSSLFDWDVSPGWINPTVRLWTPGRGVDRTSGTGAVILEFNHNPAAPQSSLVAGITRKLDPATYANVLRVSGGSYSATYPADKAGLAIRNNSGAFISSTSDGGTVDDPTDDTATVVFPTTPVTLADGSTVWDIGVWALAEDKTDLVTQAQLNAYAAQRIDELSRVAPTYTIKLRAGAWGGPSHFWLGDRIRVMIRSGRLVEDVTLRVRQIDVTPGDNGEEDVEVTVGPNANPDPLQVLRYHARDIAALRRANAARTAS